MFWSSMIVALTLLFVGTATAQTSSPPDSGEIQHAQRLQADAKQLDADAANAARTAEGQKRVTGAIATYFKVDPSVVTDLRNKKMGFGEISVALALSQELMKQDKSLTQQQALDKILAQRASGMGWGQIAKSMNLKLGHVVSEVHRADKRVERLAKLEKGEKAERAENVERAEKAERPDKIDQSSRPERVERVERGGRH